MGCSSSVRTGVKDPTFHACVPNGMPMRTVPMNKRDVVADHWRELPGQTNIMDVPGTVLAPPDLFRTSASFHDQFVIVGKLGRGNFARVYSVIDKVEGQPLAVKVSDLRHTSHDGSSLRKLDPRRQALFESEVNILKQIGKQEHCISLLDYYKEGFLTYIVMEQCEMTLLQGLEREHDIDESLYAKIFRDMLSALSSIHALNIVHLDVKPDNFLCQGTPSQGVVKLCDFGLAQRATGCPGKGNQDFHGTAPYMSPEMLLQWGYNEKSDMWSFAVIVYVLFFGCFPYKPKQGGSTAMKAAVSSGYPAPDFLPRSKLIRSMNRQHLSNTAEEFCRRVLDRDPMFRPSAQRALRHPFLGAAETEELPSLRPVLECAKQIGAFSPPMCREQKEAVDDVDSVLYELQARRGPKLSRDAKGMEHMQFPSASTAASSRTHQSSAWQGMSLSSAHQLGASSLSSSSPRNRGLNEAAALLQNHASRAARAAARSADQLPVISEQLSKSGKTPGDLHAEAQTMSTNGRRVKHGGKHKFTSLPPKIHKQRGGDTQGDLEGAAQLLNSLKIPRSTPDATEALLQRREEHDLTSPLALS